MHQTDQIWKYTSPSEDIPWLGYRFACSMPNEKPWDQSALWSAAFQRLSFHSHAHRFSVWFQCTLGGLAQTECMLCQGWKCIFLPWAAPEKILSFIRFHKQDWFNRGPFKLLFSNKEIHLRLNIQVQTFWAFSTFYQGRGWRLDLLYLFLPN